MEHILGLILEIRLKKDMDIFSCLVEVSSMSILASLPHSQGGFNLNVRHQPAGYRLRVLLKGTSTPIPEDAEGWNQQTALASSEFTHKA